MTQRLTDLQTPALVLDRGKLERNCARMRDRARQLGVRLRPHLKTSKSMDVARVALDGNVDRITVSTLTEAEYFASHGVRDILYAVVVAPNKFGRIADLLRSGVRLTSITDSLVVVEQATAFAASHDVVMPVMVEVDCGEHRTGIDPEAHPDDLLAIARRLHESDSTEFAGVVTHAGQSYACQSVAEIRDVAEHERRAAVDAAARIRAAGIDCPEVSVGSTPTATHARSLQGVTEMRPGVYVFGDLYQAAIESCDLDDIALSVLATVTAHRPDKNTLLIDAGGLALSKDRSTGRTDADAGYGRVVTFDTGETIGDLTVGTVHQEHGEVRSRHPLPYGRLPLGGIVRVLPNHACMTAAMYDRYAVVDGGTDVVDQWARVNGWDVFPGHPTP